MIKLPDILESIITVTNNFVDTVKVFIYSKKKANSYSNRRYDEKCNMTIPASTILKSSSPLLYDAEWKEYEKFIKDRGKDSKIEEASEPLPIVEERERIKEYEFQTGQKIGVVYKSKYHTMVVDAIEGKVKKDGKEHTFIYPYERLLPTVDKGAVVILTKCNDKFVLLKQFRHSLREFQYACPRGFGEEEIIVDEKTKKEVNRVLSPEENALKR